MLNPYDIAWFKSEENNRELSTTIVDVLVSLPDHTQVVVEMQVSKQKYFLERALYYVARHYVDRYGEEA